MDRQTDRQTDTQTDTQTDRHTRLKLLPTAYVDGKYQVCVERTVLDLESEAMRGLGSIPTRGNILSLDFFVFT